MPLEINELEIKTEVSCEDLSKRINSNEGSFEPDTEDRIISICIDKILQILKDRNEL